MSPETKVRLGFAAGGLLAGGLLLYATLQYLQPPDDEDRPPIIVRGGSLEFESGTVNRPGRNWKTGSVGFQMIHDRGKPVSRFQVYFEGGTGLCTPVTVADFTISFDHDGQGNTPPRLYEVRTRPDTGRPAPTVTGEGLTISSNNPTQLRVDAEATAFSIVGSNFECTNPTAVWIESIR